MQPELCVRCERRARYARLLVCETCAGRLVAPASNVVPFETAWQRYVRERQMVRVEWGRAA